MAKLKITREQLDEYAEAVLKIRSLKREAKTIEDQVKTLEKHFAAVLAEAGKPSIVRLGWTLMSVAGSVAVGWKNEFIRVAGKEAAIELQKQCTPKMRFQIKPPPGHPLATITAEKTSDDD